MPVFAYLVVAWDSNVDIAERGVGVGESDDGDVDVGCLGDGLVIGTRVRHHQQTRLTESSLQRKTDDVSSHKPNER